LLGSGEVHAMLVEVGLALAFVPDEPHRINVAQKMAGQNFFVLWKTYRGTRVPWGHAAPPPLYETRHISGLVLRVRLFPRRRVS
jgi:hypothetical protein